MIFIIDDDETMAGCIARACGDEFETKIFTNAIDAMNAIADEMVPDLIYLDILLDGPDGFTILNEIMSYPDTAQIPIVLVSTLDLNGRDLSVYGVVGVLDKAKMIPTEIRKYVQEYARS